MGLFALMAGETVVEGGAYLFTGNSATPGEPYFMTRKYFETLTGGGILDEIDKQIDPWIDNKEAYRLASIVGTSLVTAADYASVIWGVYKFAAKIGVKVLSSKSGVSLIDDIANDSSKAIKAGDELADTVTKGAGSKWIDAEGNPKWPSNNGFDGMSSTKTLQPGVRVDRYGGETGKFVSPEGTPYANRALPPGSETRPYNVYEVVKPVDVQSGKIAPWFDQPGGGIQYQFNQTIEELINSGYLRRLP